MTQLHELLLRLYYAFSVLDSESQHNIAAVLAIIILVLAILPSTKGHRAKRRILRLARRSRQYSPQEILDEKPFDFSGIYIIQNCSNHKYYVGQSVNVRNRLHQHFTGHGNGDVYADYKRGRNRFRIRAIALRGSGFRNLDDLERYAIDAYHAYTNGYNKTRGNGKS